MYDEDNVHRGHVPRGGCLCPRGGKHVRLRDSIVPVRVSRVRADEQERCHHEGCHILKQLVRGDSLRVRFADNRDGALMPRRRSRPSWLREWRELSRRTREESPQCAICGCTDRLQVHHVLDRRLYPAYRLDPDNLIVLCPRCHTFGRHSAHGNGIWFAEWLRMHRPEQYEWAAERM